MEKKTEIDMIQALVQLGYTSKKARQTIEKLMAKCSAKHDPE